MHFTAHPSYDGLLSQDDSRVVKYKQDYDKRGFDDSVTWSLDHCLIHWLTPRLRRFLEISRETTEADEFHNEVEEMLKGFELYCTTRYNEFKKEHREQLDNSFKLLAKLQSGLWW
ncbi:MAG: hypothetical protein U9O94_06995 [Nanoarchaeota archaeon]|nr:hypothetical protein [Nanoarchaeota archaeon]